MWCSCCTGEIEYNLDDLTTASQVLPRIKHENENGAKENTKRPSDSNFKNILYSFGSVSYNPKLDVNELIESKGNLVVEKIAFGDSHSLMIIKTSNDKTLLYGYGSNENGQLGLPYMPNKNNFYNNWNKIELDKEINKAFLFWAKINFTIYDVGVGNGFSIVAIKSAKSPYEITLYRFEIAKEDKFDAMNGESSSEKTTIYQEKFDTSTNGGIKQIAVFGERLLVLTNDNSVYVKGALFFLSIANNFVLYSQLPKEKEITQMNLGINHCIFTSKDNFLYCIGHNEYGEFGYVKEVLNKEGADKIKKFKTNDYFVENKLNIIKVCNGARHTLVLCDNGDIIAFGDNSDGQCCGLEKVVPTPMRVSFEEEEIDDEGKILNKVFITDIACGFNHSIAKSKDGLLYFWGDSAYDKLGFKETRVDQFSPVELSEMKLYDIESFFGGPTQSAVFVHNDLLSN